MVGTRSNEFLEAVRDEIKAWLPDLKTCAVHDGRFDLPEVKRFAVKAPAVLVACLGTVSVEDRGDEGIESLRLWAAFVLTRSTPGLLRGEAARNLVDNLELLILRGYYVTNDQGVVITDPITGARTLANRWGLRGIGPAEQVRSQNLYSASTDKDGVSLWAVTWRQKLRLEPLSEEEDCPLPSEIYLGQDPDIGMDHELDYRRVNPDPLP